MTGMVEREPPRFKDLAGDWLLEASVLVIVFPIVDQVVSPHQFRWSVATTAVAVALLMFAVGVYFEAQGGDLMGFLMTGLGCLVVFLVGLYGDRILEKRRKK